MKHLSLTILLLSLTACSSWFERKPDPPPAPVAVAPPAEDQPQGGPVDESKPLTDNIAAPMAEPIQTETVDVSQSSYIDNKIADEKAGLPTKVKVSQKVSDNVDAETALGWLKNGNKRFLKGSLRSDGQSKKDIKRLAATEKPHAVVFATSDSRIPPEIIFDEKLGEIYVVRNQSLAVDRSVIESIEYAVNDLGVKLVVVLDKTGDGKENFEVGDQTAQKLFDQSAVLKAGLDLGHLKIVPAVYDIGSGKVSFGK